MRGNLKILIIIPACLWLASCAYNSRNLLDVHGYRMNFSYGLIAIKQVDRIIILRETNTGEGTAANNLKDIQTYLCEKAGGKAEVAVLEPIVEKSPVETPETGIVEAVANPVVEVPESIPEIPQ